MKARSILPQQWTTLQNLLRLRLFWIRQEKKLDCLSMNYFQGIKRILAVKIYLYLLTLTCKKCLFKLINELNWGDQSFDFRSGKRIQQCHCWHLIQTIWMSPPGDFELQPPGKWLVFIELWTLNLKNKVHKCEKN